MQEAYHIPALLNETIDGLAIRPEGTYVDVTFGGGGHSRAIIERLGTEGHLLAFDQDQDTFANRINDDRFTFVHSNFKYIKNFLQYHNIEKIDGLLADLGVSSHHFDDAERGFSFRFDGRLDMRMNKKGMLTAEYILNNYSESQLADIFFYYGELRNARQITRTILKARATTTITHTFQFMEILKPHFGREKEKKDMARVFQALRIEVNQEMEVLKKLLTSTLEILKPGGRIAILTYHSLEDRFVKNFFKSGNFEGKVEKDFYGNALTPFRTINNKVIIATEEEVAINPRARSAKLRIAELKG